MGERIKPSDLPDGSKIEISSEKPGVFTAYYFPDGFSNVYYGAGTGKTADEAIREALDEAGE